MASIDSQDNSISGADFDVVVDFQNIPKADLKSNEPIVSQAIKVSARLKDGVIIGTMTAQIVNRDFTRPHFYKVMASICYECEMLTGALFGYDGRSRLQETYINGPQGIWGNRLNNGNFIVIQTIEVNEAYRRKYVGKGMVNGLLEKILMRGLNIDWIFAWPSRVPPEHDHDIDAKKVPRGALNMAARAFWRAMSFRRVGISSWWCFAIDDGDISRSLGADSDAEFDSDSVLGSAHSSDRDLDSNGGMDTDDGSDSEPATPPNETQPPRQQQAEPETLSQPRQGLNIREGNSDDEDFERGIFDMEL